jgi:hypothetical protein
MPELISKGNANNIEPTMFIFFKCIVKSPKL